MSRARWALYRAWIEGRGLLLDDEPTAYASILREALVLAADDRHHGREGVAIVSLRSGRVIYTAEEYDTAYARVAS